MKQYNKKKTGIIVLLLGVTALFLWTLWANTALECSVITLFDKNLPVEFSGFTIAQVSDLHNAEFGKNNTALLQLLKETGPDMIAITGDLVDSRRTDISVALRFAEQAAAIAPVYYVTGNHESRLDEFSEPEAGLKTAGAILLRNESTMLEREGAQIRLIGLDDPSFAAQTNASKWADTMLDTWGKVQDKASFTVLLSHRPERFRFIEHIRWIWC